MNRVWLTRMASGCGGVIGGVRVGISRERLVRQEQQVAVTACQLCLVYDS